MADQYVYILSNPSMEGLIKIGKTRTHPSQRMAELRTTGVPTPFELECAFVVDDCTVREKAAHAALGSCRVAGNREFFRISVEAALRKILPLLGPYSLYHAKSAYNIEALESEIQKLEAARREREEQRRDKQRQKATLDQKKQQRQLEIEDRLRREEYEIGMWYKEKRRELFPERSKWLYSPPAMLLAFFLLPEVFPHLTEPGLVIGIAAAGWAGGALLKGIIEGRREKSAAFEALAAEREGKFRAVREVIKPCPACGTQLRFRRADVLAGDEFFELCCPACKTVQHATEN